MENSNETLAENDNNINAKEDDDDDNNVQEPVTENATFNPSLTDDLKEDIEKIKGDAIGDTLYSSRFVLKTLIKLTKFDKTLDTDEPFEQELCSLWDMTIEKDVVKLLLEQNVLELFSGIISATEDQRLTEILVGIIGNMCALPQTREELCGNPEIMAALLDLVSCSDSLILVQLMRLLHATLVFENTGDEITWFQHFQYAEGFVEKFSFLLCNSMSNTLLFNAFEALLAICSKFAMIDDQINDKDTAGFKDTFIQPCLVNGVLEAFKQMLPSTTNGHMDDTSTPTQKSQKTMNLFLDIHVSLSNFDNVSKQCYEPFLNELFECISQILQPLCQPIYLFPLTSNEQGYIENINEIFQALGDPFHEKCFAQMIEIWSMIDAKQRNTNNGKDWGENEDDDADDNDDEEEVDVDDVNMTILEFITRTSKLATVDSLQNSLKSVDKKIIVNLCESLEAGDSEPDIKECYTKIQETSKILWDIHFEKNS